MWYSNLYLYDVYVHIYIHIYIYISYSPKPNIILSLHANSPSQSTNAITAHCNYDIYMSARHTIHYMHLVIHVRATPFININLGLLHLSQKYSRFSLEHSYQGDSKMTRMPLSSLLCFFIPQPKPAWPLVRLPLSPHQASRPSMPSLAEPQASPTMVEAATGSWLRVEPAPRSSPSRPNLACTRSP